MPYGLGLSEGVVSTFSYLLAGNGKMVFGWSRSGFAQPQLRLLPTLPWARLRPQGEAR